MLMIITISGKAEHGKDSFANLLKEKLEHKGKKVLILHYADYLKFIAEKYMDWDGKKDINGRTLLQQLGTEKARNYYTDFWVNAVYNVVKLFQYDYDYFLIPDTRFPNEINFWKNKKENIKSVKIVRLGYENSLTEEQRNHPSETSLDNYKFDYLIQSSGGLDSLSIDADYFIERVGI